MAGREEFTIPGTLDASLDGALVGGYDAISETLELMRGMARARVGGVDDVDRSTNNGLFADMLEQILCSDVARAIAGLYVNEELYDQGPMPTFQGVVSRINAKGYFTNKLGRRLGVPAEMQERIASEMDPRVLHDGKGQSLQDLMFGYFMQSTYAPVADVFPIPGRDMLMSGFPIRGSRAFGDGYEDKMVGGFVFIDESRSELYRANNLYSVMAECALRMHEDIDRGLVVLPDITP